jgi:DNA sulfur modification protein DndD
MIIKKIIIENFQSYFNVNEIEFGKGLNLIIGNGGKGKSKLFNAFYWALFGKIYITDNGWEDTNTLDDSPKIGMGSHEVINKRALSLTPLDKTEKTSVIIELSNNENGREVDYIIERNIVVKRVSENSWTERCDWNVLPSELKVSYDSITGTVVREHDYAKLAIEDLFPEGIRNYIWFQGESLDSLIDFRKKETLKAAVKHISYYPMYEKLSQIISLATEKISKIELKKSKEQYKNNKEIQSLISTIESSKIKLERTRQDKEQLDNEILMLESTLHKDEKRMEGLGNFTGLVENYNRCEQELKDVMHEMGSLDAYQRKELPKSWILRGVNEMIDDCKQIILNYTTEQDTLPEKKYLDNPGRAKLEEILSDHKCYVCGQVVSEESEAYNTITRRIKEQEVYLQELEEYSANLGFNKKFERFIGGITDYPDSIKVSLSVIDKNFQDSENKVEKLISKRKILLDRKLKLDQQMADIKSKYHVDPKREAGSANVITSGLKATRGNVERLRGRLDSVKSQIHSLENEIKRCEKEFSKLNTSDKGSKITETEWKDLSEFLKVICGKVQEKARKELLCKIQSRANDFYNQFTKHDNGYKGSITINDDYSIAFDSGLNTSHEDRKKMSIINALLSLNQDALNVYYPFISDAPTSNFDLETSQSYLFAIKDMYEQTIIMTKDVDINNKWFLDLKLSSNVAKIYKLESDLFDSTSIEPAIHEVATKISLIK